MFQTNVVDIKEMYILYHASLKLLCYGSKEPTNQTINH
jgi:hypothetical protein